MLYVFPKQMRYQAALLPDGSFPRESGLNSQPANGTKRNRLARCGTLAGTFRATPSKQVGPAGRQPDEARPHRVGGGMARKHVSDCVVYFISGGGLIKIGTTSNLTKRFGALRWSSPIQLELLGHYPGSTFEESLAHAHFAHLRRHGEWFEDHPDIRAWIVEEQDRRRGRALTPKASPNLSSRLSLPSSEKDR